MEEVSLRRDRRKRRKANDQIVQKKRWINRCAKIGSYGVKLRRWLEKTAKRKRQSQKNNSCLKAPFIFLENTHWLEHLSSLNHEDQNVERTKASATLKLFPDWITLNHMAVTLWRVWKKETLPILCLPPAAKSLFMTSAAVSTGWSPLPPFLYVCLFILIFILTFISLPIPTWGLHCIVLQYVH